MKLSGGKKKKNEGNANVEGNFRAISWRANCPYPRPFHFYAQNPVENNGPRRRRPYGRVEERLNQDE